MQTLLELLKSSSKELQHSHVGDARLSAEILLAHILGCKRMDLYLHFDQPLEEKEVKAYQLLLERRKKREPVAYICGSVPFFHLEIEVNKDVLIPRPETELLVEKMVDRLKKEDLSGKLFMDLCTGSGCMALAIKQNFPELRVAASDISPQALEVAKRNAKNNSLVIEYHLGDLLEGFSEKIDFLCCNPPYISEEEQSSLEEEVVLYEPREALFAKDFGYEFYERLSQILPSYLHPKAKIFFEIGKGQKSQMQKIFCQKPWILPQFFCDYNGIDRFFFLETE